MENHYLSDVNNVVFGNFNTVRGTDNIVRGNLQRVEGQNNYLIDWRNTFGKPIYNDHVIRIWKFDIDMDNMEALKDNPYEVVQPLRMI